MKDMKFKKIIKYVIAFFIPVFIVLIHIFSKEIVEGNYIKNCENFLLADMASQYNSIYGYVWDLLRGNESIFYSFGKGLGGNMASTVGYYAASPFNVLYLFISKGNIPIMTFIIYLIKIGLASLFMYYYFKKKYEDKESYLFIMFSIMYSLMAYTVNYYFNNMWLDVILLTPLVMLGIDKIIDNKSFKFYTIVLAIAIISNFYIAFMLCIFCVIYFLYQFLLKYKIKEIKKHKNIILKFILGSLIAGGLSCFLLLPSLLNLKEVMRFPLDKSLLKINFKSWKNDIFNNIICKLYLGTHNTTSVLSRNRPNLYSGLLTLVLCFFYYFNKNIKIKEKIFTLIIMIFFILSFMIPHLNLFWQAGSFPNGYICRYSFLFSFFIISIALRCFIKLDKIKIRYFIVFAILFGFSSYKIANQYLVFIEKKDIIISCLFIAFYLLVLLGIMYFKREDYKRQLKFILFMAVLFELFLNFRYCFLANSDMKVVGNYKHYYTQSCPVLNNLDDDFYRVDGDYKYSYLDSWICHNNTVTTSLSTNTGDLYRFWKKNGGNVTYTTIMFDMNKLPIFDALFGVKYITSENKLKDSLYDYNSKFKTKKYKYSENRYVNKTNYIYQNPYALSLGYLIPKNNETLYNKYNVEDSFQSLNRLMKTLTGNDEDVLKPYKKKYLGKNKYEFDINNDEKYLYLSFDYDVSINWTIYDSIYINDEYITSATSDDVGSLRVDNNYKNQKIKVKIGNDENVKIQDNLVIYYFDMEVFEKDVNILKQSQLRNIKLKNNKLEGDIEVNKDSTLFLSLPYEKGWNVYVDGKKTKYNKVVDEFIGVDVSKGTHHIKMIYYSHHVFLGIFVSIISLIVLIVCENYVKLKKLLEKRLK